MSKRTSDLEGEVQLSSRTERDQVDWDEVVVDSNVCDRASSFCGFDSRIQCDS